jgi:hypothetical protein
MNNGKYLVIVYPGPPAAEPPRVVEVDARFPADAAEKANVRPGGHCIVVTDAQRFDRAPQAPLEPKALDGNPLPAKATA